MGAAYDKGAASVSEVLVNSLESVEREIKMSNLSWKPRLNGKTYCAPACGGGCTKAAYDNAVASANALVKRMKGAGWRTVVFENFGWHWRVISGPVQVYPSGDGRFWAMISSEPKGSAGGLAAWTPTRNLHFKDPNRAARHALKYAEQYVSKLNEVITAACEATGMKPTSPKRRGRG